MAINDADNIGLEDFSEVISDKYAYYVDKTKYLENVFGSSTKVMLFTRPRRFGKSLTISMFEYFLKMNYSNPHNKSKAISLFKNLEIFKKKEFVLNNLAQYPVINVSFKEVSSTRSYEEALGNLGDRLSSIADRIHAELFGKFRFVNYLRWFNPLNLLIRHKLQQILYINIKNYDLEKKAVIIKNGLATIITALSRYTGKKVIVLVDEYDVPLAKNSCRDFYEDFKTVYAAMLSNALKTNSDLKKAVLTGCMLVAKESIFTGFNNFYSSDFNDPEYSEFYGFTENEVKTMLKHYGLEDKFDVFREWYDGYNFGKSHIFCPWDVLNCIRDLKADPNCELDTYWVNTGNVDLLQELYRKNADKYSDKFQLLLDGQSIEVELEKNLNYQMLNGDVKENYFWTVMYLTGYLTRDLTKESKVFLKIPNKSVKRVIKKLLSWCFSVDNPQFEARVNPILKYIKDKQDKALITTFDNLLLRYVSVSDISSSGLKEYFYQGFLNGIFSQVCNTLDYYYNSNSEYGTGRCYITFKIPPVEENKLAIGVVIEIKVADSQSDLEKKAELAINQIKEKQYAQGYFVKNLVSEVVMIGVAFYKKSSFVKIETMN